MPLREDEDVRTTAARIARVSLDQPPTKWGGKESVRALGELWTIGEMLGEMPGDGGNSRSIMTLGFDPQTKQFVGTFIASVMTHLWPYRGTLDADERILTLDSEGPSFAGDGSMAKYQDLLEFIDNDNRILSSQVLGPDGKWAPFMKSHYRRTKS